MKNTEKRMLSRKDAAAVLGCSQQTVSNWVENGTLKGHLINGRLFVDADTLHAVTDTVAEIESAKRKLEELQLEYEAKRRELEDKVNAKREELHFFKCSAASRVTLHAFAAVLNSYCDEMPQRERDVLLDIVHYGDADCTSQRFDIPTERVLKIADKACRRIGTIKHGSTVKENSYLKQKVEELTRENERLMMYIRKGSDCGVVPAEFARNPILDSKVTDCDFSVRTLNCLRCIGVETVEQLTQTPMSEIIKVRNVGRKTTSEIEDFISRNGLKQAK